MFLIPTGLALATPITIVSITGSQNGQSVLSAAFGETWTQTGAYTGVTISANLIGGADKTATAYLMNQIGPGTTALNRGSGTVSHFGFNRCQYVHYALFRPHAGTGHLLPADRWDERANPLGWPGTLGPTFTEDTGVSGGQELVVSGTEASFSPASTFSTQSGALFFSVTGTPGASSSTPEPGTLAMLGAGRRACRIQAKYDGRAALEPA